MKSRRIVTDSATAKMTASAFRQHYIFLRLRTVTDAVLRTAPGKCSFPRGRTMRIDGRACASHRRRRAMEDDWTGRPCDRVWPCVGVPGIWVGRPSWTGCHPARPHSVTDPSACLAARSPLMEAPSNSPRHRVVTGRRPEPPPAITPTRLRASVEHARARLHEIYLKSRKTRRAA